MILKPETDGGYLTDFLAAAWGGRYEFAVFVDNRDGYRLRASIPQTTLSGSAFVPQYAIDRAGREGLIDLLLDRAREAIALLSPWAGRLRRLATKPLTKRATRSR